MEFNIYRLDRRSIIQSSIELTELIGQEIRLFRACEVTLFQDECPESFPCCPQTIRRFLSCFVSGRLLLHLLFIHITFSFSKLVDFVSHMIVTAVARSKYVPNRNISYHEKCLMLYATPRYQTHFRLPLKQIHSRDYQGKLIPPSSVSGLRELHKHTLGIRMLNICSSPDGIFAFVTCVRRINIAHCSVS